MLEICSMCKIIFPLLQPKNISVSIAEAIFKRKRLIEVCHLKTVSCRSQTFHCPPIFFCSSVEVNEPFQFNGQKGGLGEEIGGTMEKSLYLARGEERHC